ncbi:MAG: GDSL-type esterase/lipase family protein [Chloroflexi bacterium]|nr:GDSL-type esterase/lipase family protein [Chloroflexota bacterium]
MKRLVVIISILLGACSQSMTQTESPQTAEPSGEVVAVETFVPEPLSTVPALPSGPVTLVALGDSLTQGDGDDTGRGGYAGRVLEMVSAIRPDSTLVNLGQSGWSSDALINGDQGLESQLTRAVAEVTSASSQGRNALALVWIGSNDLWYLYEFGGEGSDENDTLDGERFSTNMDTIISQLRSAGAQVIVAMLDDQSKRPVALKREAFTAITSDELNRMSSQVVVYNQIIAAKAPQYGALTVDFYPTDIFTNPATLYDDGNHPNSDGYDIIAQKWFDVISRILK